MKENPRDTPPRGTVAEYVAALKGSPRFGSQVVHHEQLAAREPVFAEPEIGLPAALRTALAGLGIDRLYRHQAEALDLVRRGNHVMVATPTASGKSLIYNLPVFEQLLASDTARALYLFPLKALAQDQFQAVNRLAAGLPDGPPGGTLAAIYDGDTSAYKRRKFREMPPRILITNPDMLHLSMLGYHERWGDFLAGLTHVIIDEVHTYRGVFGSHMAWVIRRLERLCRHYGSRPRFIMTSATVGNPAELAAQLLGQPAAVVVDTGAPRAGRDFLFLNPMESAAHVACQMLEAAMARQLRTIVYTQSRMMTELISIWTRARLGEAANKLSAYRAGFLPEERREIEAGLTGGDLLGVIATSALELGIDIGALDICILVGYPGTVMATWQRSGRVGRGGRRSLTVLLGREDSLDQHFMRNPADFFNRGVEAVVLNPANRRIMGQHLVCAAAELPLAFDEPLLQGEGVREAVDEAVETTELLVAGDGERIYGSRKYPHRHIDLRGSGRGLTIRAGGRAAGDHTVIGEIDGYRCQRECHPGAVYLHRGQSWLVTDLDLHGREVIAMRKKVPYFTRAMGTKETEILHTHATRRLRNFTVSFGTLRITDTVTGYQKRLTAGQKLIATVPLDLPPLVFETEGLWLHIPLDLQAEIETARLHFMGGIHALEHAAIGVFPLLVLCDRNDIGGIAQPAHPQLSTAAVFIYDGQAGGVGLSRKAFDEVEELLATSRRTIVSCPCELGCPSCIHSPKCGSGNRPMDKEAAVRLLDGLLSPAGHRAGRRQRDKETPVVPATVAAAPAVHSPLRYGVFDLETQLSADEVGGWHRAERMKISVAVLYDSADDRFHTYPEEDIQALVSHLGDLDLVVGFNNKRFDNQVLSAYTDADLNRLPTLDILEEVYRRLSYRLSLDRLALHTLGVSKTGNGLQALKWFKEGKMAELSHYCRKDVEITRDLYLFGLRNRYLLFGNKAGKVVRLPVCFDREKDQNK